MNGFVTGTKRPVSGMENLGFYEVWNGKNWVSEDIWNYEHKKCTGCDNPFCECRGKLIDSSQKSNADIKERIYELIKLQQEISQEIMSLVNQIGGDA